jgi:predicted branched-subunit amino acid permease
MWAAGTAVGISMGSILPARIVSALSVALFGMFIASIIPPARKDRAVALAIAVSFACSLACEHIPVIKDMSSGTRLTILAIGISALFALVIPRADKKLEELEESSGQKEPNKKDREVPHEN